MSIAPAIERHYPGLNDDQRAIVGHLDGPLLVIAGPGSGKTYSIVLRALNLLLLQKAQPKQLVLCTFTEKAAFEMRDRLAAAARKVGYVSDLSELAVSTIHSFCNRVLTQHRHRTELGHSFDTLDELTQLLLIFEHFDEIVGPPENDRFLGKWKTRWTAIEGARGYFDKIDTAVDECAKLKQRELHVLGWEWEMGLYDLMVEAAKKKEVKLLLLQIPREVMEQQAAAMGDVRFFELAYLEAKIEKPKNLTAQVALKDFVIPNTDLIPEDVRSKVKKWSDYIDYWAVDWDFQNDTFMQGWVAYRTRKERKLPRISYAHAYEKPGKYRILVKVIDIFGNDTSQAFDVEVK